MLSTVYFSQMQFFNNPYKMLSLKITKSSFHFSLRVDICKDFFLKRNPPSTSQNSLVDWFLFSSFPPWHSFFVFIKMNLSRYPIYSNVFTMAQFGVLIFFKYLIGVCFEPKLKKIPSQFLRWVEKVKMSRVSKIIP